MKRPLHCLLLLTISIYACREQPKAVPAITTPDYDKAQSFLNQNEDSAYYYFNKVATTSKDSLQIARAYNFMGILQYERGDYFGSQESLLTSLKYLNAQKEDEYYCFVADYNQLGRSSANLKNYDAAINYYDQALKYAKDETFKVIALNNKAVTYQHMRKYAQAVAIYQSILDESRKNKREYARILSNISKVKWLQDPGYHAAPDLLLALQIRKEEKDEWGLNASYSHLSDYYAHSRPDSALIYATKMYATAQNLKSPDDELEALQKLIVLSEAKASKQYFAQYQSLSDSMQTARNAAKNQFAVIRYEVQKNKADNLRLQKENSERTVQITQQREIIYAILAVFIAAVYISRILYKKRKQRLEWEAQSAIHENQLKTSQKVHDVVANGLYSLMAEIEHQEMIEKDQLLDRVEVLYEQSRNISYDHNEGTRLDFQSTITSLLTPFSSPTTKVLVTGNDKDLWVKVKDPAKKQIEQILRELMINMKKHSAAQNVIVRFQRSDQGLNVRYTDDGIGLPPSFRYGNGLTNTENRIKGLNGQIIFDKNIPKGLTIQINLPII